MDISIIAAVAKNRAIGYQNKLIYWLPDDLKRFKQLTTGHTKGALPNRRNVVISRTVDSLPGCEVYASLEEALSHCEDDEHIYIIGGASVYEQAMQVADRLCLTEIEDTPAEADVFFPSYDAGWEETWREQHEKDERHAQRFAFVDYVRVKQ